MYVISKIIVFFFNPPNEKLHSCLEKVGFCFSDCDEFYLVGGKKLCEGYLEEEKLHQSLIVFYENCLFFERSFQMISWDLVIETNALHFDRMHLNSETVKILSNLNLGIGWLYCPS